MEKLTNQYNEFLDAVKKELSAIEMKQGEKLVVRYLELPWISGDWFSLFLVKSASGAFSIVQKYWDREYDRKRFVVGIFNPERACIKERKAALSADQQRAITAIVDSITEVPDLSKKSIVIDGIDTYLLICNDKNHDEYYWNIGPEKIECFRPLITWLKAFSFV